MPADAPAALGELALAARGKAEVPAAMIVVAHPDDEVIGVGALLPHLPGVTVVHATDGAPRDLSHARAAGCETREQYADARRHELSSALALANVRAEQTVALGYIDLEASLHLVELAGRLAELLSAVRPAVVLTHAYEGGHPDHDAVAFATHAAVESLRRARGAAPALVEMAGYHGYGKTAVAGRFLPVDGVEAVTVRLSERARARKRQMFACFATQQRVLAAFPISVERYRVAPRYDFGKPPHPGPLLYERFGGEVTGAWWTALARAARTTLGLEARG